MSGGLQYFHSSLWKLPDRLAVSREERPDLLREDCCWISPGGVEKKKNIVCNSTASNIFVQILPQCSKNHIHSPCLESKEPCNKSVNTANHICWLWVRVLTGKSWNESSKHKIPELHQSYLSSLHITVNSSGSQKTPSWIWSVKKRIFHVENVCEFFSPFISSYIDLISVEEIPAEIHQSISNAFDFGDWRHWLEM